MVYLTATLGPANEAKFFEAIGVEKEEVTMIREATIRQSIVYSVVGYSKKEED